MEAYLKSGLLLFVLLNPFLLSIYLGDLMRDTEAGVFARIAARAGVISTVVFVVFGLAGEAIFTEVFQARFSSFLIFGGIVFLIIGLRMTLTGSPEMTRIQGGDPGRVSGTVAMPFMIGPGTVSAAVIIGTRLQPGEAAGVIALSVAAAVVSLIGLKRLHDFVKVRHEPLVGRYTEITGRIMALYTGTIAVEMILKGIDKWLQRNSVLLG
jgi:multiple antibiotic resistance protein